VPELEAEHAPELRIDLVGGALQDDVGDDDALAADLLRIGLEAVDPVLVDAVILDRDAFGIGRARRRRRQQQQRQHRPQRPRRHPHRVRRRHRDPRPLNSSAG